MEEFNVVKQDLQVDTQYLGSGDDFCPAILVLVALAPLTQGVCGLFLEGFKDGLTDARVIWIDTNAQESIVARFGIINRAALRAAIVRLEVDSEKGIVLGLPDVVTISQSAKCVKVVERRSNLLWIIVQSVRDPVVEQHRIFLLTSFEKL